MSISNLNVRQFFFYISNIKVMGNAKIFLFDNDETLDSYRAGGVKKSHHHAAAMLWFFISSTVYILDSEILAILFSFGSFDFLPAGLGRNQAYGVC